MSNFGIDLLLESQKANIKNKNDVLVILMHWMLCRNNVRNVGVGESVNISEFSFLLIHNFISFFWCSQRDFQEDDRPSELLPEGWNTMEPNKYQLRYTQDKKIYILHAIVTGDTLLINLLVSFYYN